MSMTKIRAVFMGVTMLLLVAILTFTGALNITSFKKSHRDSLIANYVVAGKETVQKIEYAIKYGKPLQNFYSMSSYLRAIKNDAAGVEDVWILDEEGRALYTLKETAGAQRIPEGLWSQVDFKYRDREVESFSGTVEETCHIFIPIRDAEKKLTGTLDILFEEAAINNRVDESIRKILLNLFILSFVVVLILFITLYKIPIVDQHGLIRRKLLFGILLTVVGISQAIFCLINTIQFKDTYLQISKENSSLAARIIQRDINTVIEKGIPYDELYKMEDWMLRITKSIPELESIYVSASKDAIIYATSGNITQEGKTVNEDYWYNLDLIMDGREYKGKLNVMVSEGYIRDKLFNMVLDAVTILVTSFIFLFEIAVFLMIFLKKQVEEKQSLENDDGDLSVLRTLGFIFFMGASIATTFIPVLMKKLYQPVLGLSLDVACALPLSIEMLGCAFATIVSGFIMERKGWRRVFFAGIGMMAMGSVFSALAWETFSFIGARGLTGIGYGFAGMAIQTFISQIGSLERRNEGYAHYQAGIAAGMNCGCILGAMLLERIGFSEVFYIGFVILGLSAVFAYFFTKVNRGISQELNDEASSGIDKPSTVFLKTVTVSNSPQEKGNDFKSFITRRNVLAILSLMIFPAAICGMFMEYYFPLYAAGEGVSAANTGRAFLLNGLCMIYLGPFFGKILARYVSLKTGAVLASLMVGSSLIFFGIYDSIWVAFLSVLFMGLADSFGEGARFGFFSQLKEIKGYGEGKSLSVMNMVMTLGEIAGPMLFGVAVFWGAAKGVALIGAGVIVTALVFIWVAKTGKETAIICEGMEENILLGKKGG